VVLNLKDLERLDILDYFFNGEIPEDIIELSMLENLYIIRLPSDNFPEVITLIHHLKKLYLYTIISYIPESIGNLKLLEEFAFSGESLERLPESFGNLTSLVKLELASNRLTILPESIGNLTSLQNFQLSGNKLTSLPDSILNLTSLKKIFLWENQLNEGLEVISTLRDKGVEVMI